MNRTRRRGALEVLALPIALCVLSIAGLVIGLTGSGWRDSIAVGALATPLILFLFHILRSARPTLAPNEKVRP